MAIDLCDVAAVLRCNPDPDNTMFRNLVLRALLGLTEASSGSGVVLAEKSFAFGAVPVAFADTTLLDSTGKLKRLYVRNQTDSDIAISFDNGVTTAFTVLANQEIDRNVGNFTAAAQDDLQFKYLGTAPTSGSVFFDGSY